MLNHKLVSLRSKREGDSDIFPVSKHHDTLLEDLCGKQEGLWFLSSQGVPVPPYAPLFIFSDSIKAEGVAREVLMTSFNQFCLSHSLSNVPSPVTLLFSSKAQQIPFITFISTFASLDDHSPFRKFPRYFVEHSHFFEHQLSLGYLQSQIRQCFPPNTLLCIRSSFEVLGEDQGKDAGMFHSELRIDGSDLSAVLKSLRRVFASAFSAHALPKWASVVAPLKIIFQTFIKCETSFVAGCTDSGNAVFALSSGDCTKNVNGCADSVISFPVNFSAHQDLLAGRQKRIDSGERFPEDTLPLPLLTLFYQLVSRLGSFNIEGGIDDKGSLLVFQCRRMTGSGGIIQLPEDSVLFKGLVAQERVGVPLNPGVRFISSIVPFQTNTRFDGSAVIVSELTPECVKHIVGCGGTAIFCTGPHTQMSHAALTIVGCAEDRDGNLPVICNWSQDPFLSHPFTVVVGEVTCSVIDGNHEQTLVQRCSKGMPEWHEATVEPTASHTTVNSRESMVSLFTQINHQALTLMGSSSLRSCLVSSFATADLLQKGERDKDQLLREASHFLSCVRGLLQMCFSEDDDKNTVLNFSTQRIDALSAELNLNYTQSNHTFSSLLKFTEFVRDMITLELGDMNTLKLFCSGISEQEINIVVGLQINYSTTIDQFSAHTILAGLHASLKWFVSARFPIRSQQALALQAEAANYRELFSMPVQAVALADDHIFILIPAGYHHITIDIKGHHFKIAEYFRPSEAEDKDYEGHYFRLSLVARTLRNSGADAIGTSLMTSGNNTLGCELSGNFERHTPPLEVIQRLFRALKAFSADIDLIARVPFLEITEPGPFSLETYIAYSMSLFHRLTIDSSVGFRHFCLDLGTRPFPGDIPSDALDFLSRRDLSYADKMGGVFGFLYQALGFVGPLPPPINTPEVWNRVALEIFHLFPFDRSETTLIFDSYQGNSSLFEQVFLYLGLMTHLGFNASLSPIERSQKLTDLLRFLSEPLRYVADVLNSPILQDYLNFLKEFLTISGLSPNFFMAAPLRQIFMSLSTEQKTVFQSQLDHVLLEKNNMVFLIKTVEDFSYYDLIP